MKKVVVLCLCCLIGSMGHGQTITWDASSGLLPSDASIEENSRFELSGDSSWLSFQDGAMNVNDSSTTYQLGIGKSDIVPPDLTSDWAFQIELRTNSNSRPTFDFGATMGMTVLGKRSFLAIASDRVGFAGDTDYINGQSYLMDTTDGFHIYRVIKESDVVSLYVDTFDLPVLSIGYDLFPVYADHGTSVTLTMSSNPGVADYDIKSYAYNSNGTTVPEPMTLSLLFLGGIFMRRKA